MSSILMVSTLIAYRSGTVQSVFGGVHRSADGALSDNSATAYESQLNAVAGIFGAPAPDDCDLNGNPIRLLTGSVGSQENNLLTLNEQLMLEDPKVAEGKVIQAVVDAAQLSASNLGSQVVHEIQSGAMLDARQLVIDVAQAGILYVDTTTSPTTRRQEVVMSGSKSLVMPANLMTASGSRGVQPILISTYPAKRSHDTNAPKQAQVVLFAADGTDVFIHDEQLLSGNKHGLRRTAPIDDPWISRMTSESTSPRELSLDDFLAAFDSYTKVDSPRQRNRFAGGRHFNIIGGPTRSPIHEFLRAESWSTTTDDLAAPAQHTSRREVMSSSKSGNGLFFAPSGDHPTSSTTDSKK
jgi:hypothetical protein